MYESAAVLMAENRAEFWRRMETRLAGAPEAVELLMGGTMNLRRFVASRKCAPARPFVI